MKKGFTLLELIVVIIIVGILATLALTQYGRMVERARGSEARTVIGDIRKYAAAFRMEFGNISQVTPGQLNLGTGVDTIPNASTCRTSHYFWYGYATTGTDVINMTATRCIAGSSGKTPLAPNAWTYWLWANLSSGNESIGGTGDY